MNIKTLTMTEITFLFSFYELIFAWMLNQLFFFLFLFFLMASALTIFCLAISFFFEFSLWKYKDYGFFAWLFYFAWIFAFLEWTFSLSTVDPGSWHDCPGDSVRLVINLEERNCMEGLLYLSSYNFFEWIIGKHGTVGKRKLFFSLWTGYMIFSGLIYESIDLGYWPAWTTNVDMEWTFCCFVFIGELTSFYLYQNEYTKCMLYFCLFVLSTSLFFLSSLSCSLSFSTVSLMLSLSLFLSLSHNVETLFAECSRCVSERIVRARVCVCVGCGCERVARGWRRGGVSVKANGCYVQGINEHAIYLVLLFGFIFSIYVALRPLHLSLLMCPKYSDLCLIGKKRWKYDQS